MEQRELSVMDLFDKRGFEKCRFLCLMCTVLLVLCVVGTASAETWSVDGSNTTEVQKGVNNASAGDTILVSRAYYDKNRGCR